MLIGIPQVCARCANLAGAPKGVESTSSRCLADISSTIDRYFLVIYRVYSRWFDPWWDFVGIGASFKPSGPQSQQGSLPSMGRSENRTKADAWVLKRFETETASRWDLIARAWKTSVTKRYRATRRSSQCVSRTSSPTIAHVVLEFRGWGLHFESEHVALVRTLMEGASEVLPAAAGDSQRRRMTTGFRSSPRLMSILSLHRRDVERAADSPRKPSFRKATCRALISRRVKKHDRASFPGEPKLAELGQTWSNASQIQSFPGHLRSDFGEFGSDLAKFVQISEGNQSIRKCLCQMWSKSGRSWSKSVDPGPDKRCRIWWNSGQFRWKPGPGWTLPVQIWSKSGPNWSNSE